MANVARKLRVVDSNTTSDRLKKAFPEIDFDAIIAKGSYNHHNLHEKWDALVRQVDWWLTL